MGVPPADSRRAALTNSRLSFSAKWAFSASMSRQYSMKTKTGRIVAIGMNIVGDAAVLRTGAGAMVPAQGYQFSRGFGAGADAAGDDDHGVGLLQSRTSA